MDLIIDENNIVLHYLSSQLDGAEIIYYYNNDLYRSPFLNYQAIFDKVIHLPYIQSTIKVNGKINWNGNALLMYKHKKYDHLIRIDEASHSRRKDFVQGICAMNAVAVACGIVCIDIHENNIFDTVDGIKWVDLGAFKPVTSDNVNMAFLYTCAQVHWHILHSHSAENRNFTVEFISNGPLAQMIALDFAKPESWQKLSEIVGELKIELKKTEWTEYPDKMIVLNNPTHSIKSKIVWELVKEMEDVRTVIDIGCHVGYYTFLSAKYCDSVLGVDIDEICINKAVNCMSNLKLPVCFAAQAVEQLSKNYFHLFDRYKSDMVMALAIIHHLHKDDKKITPARFVGLLTKLSKKYILIENITLEDLAIYDKEFVSYGLKLIKRFDIVPDNRKLSLYQNVSVPE